MIRSAMAAHALFLAVFACGAAHAQSAAVPRLVLQGYDPVAYFTDGRPVQGDPGLSYDWDGGRYYFSSAKSREAFAANPDRYAPRFGGYCTGSMSRGEYNEVDPHAWIISDGKLYLFGHVKFRHIAETEPAFLPAKASAASEHWRLRR